MGLAELLAAAEKKKHLALREKLGIATELKLTGTELEFLAHLMVDREGEVYLRLEGDVLRAGEVEGASSLFYRGDAVAYILKTWRITRDEARSGITVTIKNGSRS